MTYCGFFNVFLSSCRVVIVSKFLFHSLVHDKNEKLGKIFSSNFRYISSQTQTTLTNQISLISIFQRVRASLCNEQEKEKHFQFHPSSTFVDCIEIIQYYYFYIQFPCSFYISLVHFLIFYFIGIEKKIFFLISKDTGDKSHGKVRWKLEWENVEIIFRDEINISTTFYETFPIN